MAFPDVTNNAVELIECFMDIIFIIDIIFQFFIPFYNYEEDLIKIRYLIAINYLTGWFFIDLVASIPGSIITYFMVGIGTENTKISDLNNINSSIQTTTSFENINKLTRLAKFYRVLKITKLSKVLKMSGDSSSKKSNSKTIIKEKIGLSNAVKRILNSFFIFLFASHMISCIWIFIGSLDNPNWLIKARIIDSDNISIYISSVYFLWTTIFTIGYGDILSANTLERLINIFLMFVGVLIYSFAVSALGTIVSGYDKSTERYMKNIDKLYDMKLMYNIPMNSYDKIEKYLLYDYKNNKMEKFTFINDLPIRIRNELLVNMYRDVIKNFKFFKETSIEFTTKVVFIMKPLRLFKKEYVLIEGEVAEEIIFVRKGYLTIHLGTNYNEARVIDIRSNEHFGDILTMLDLPSPIGVKVSSRFCDLIIIRKEDLIELANLYPECIQKIIWVSSYNYYSMMSITEKIKEKINFEKQILEEKQTKYKKFLEEDDIDKKMNDINKNLKSENLMKEIEENFKIKNTKKDNFYSNLCRLIKNKNSEGINNIAKDTPIHNNLNSDKSLLFNENNCEDSHANFFKVKMQSKNPEETKKTFHEGNLNSKSPLDKINKNAEIKKNSNHKSYTSRNIPILTKLQEIKIDNNTIKNYHTKNFHENNMESPYFEKTISCNSNANFLKNESLLEILQISYNNLNNKNLINNENSLEYSNKISNKNQENSYENSFDNDFHPKNNNLELIKNEQDYSNYNNIKNDKTISKINKDLTYSNINNELLILKENKISGIYTIKENNKEKTNMNLDKIITSTDKIITENYGNYPLKNKITVNKQNYENNNTNQIFENLNKSKKDFTSLELNKQKYEELKLPLQVKKIASNSNNIIYIDNLNINNNCNHIYDSGKKSYQNPYFNSIEANNIRKDSKLDKKNNNLNSFLNIPYKYKEDEYDEINNEKKMKKSFKSTKNNNSSHSPQNQSDLNADINNNLLNNNSFNKSNIHNNNNNFSNRKHKYSIKSDVYSENKRESFLNTKGINYSNRHTIEEILKKVNILEENIKEEKNLIVKDQKSKKSSYLHFEELEEFKKINKKGNELEEPLEENLLNKSNLKIQNIEKTSNTPINGINSTGKQNCKNNNLDFLKDIINHRKIEFQLKEKMITKSRGSLLLNFNRINNLDNNKNDDLLSNKENSSNRSTDKIVKIQYSYKYDAQEDNIKRDYINKKIKENNRFGIFDQKSNCIVEEDLSNMNIDSLKKSKINSTDKTHNNDFSYQRNDKSSNFSKLAINIGSINENSQAKIKDLFLSDEAKSKESDNENQNNKIPNSFNKKKNVILNNKNINFAKNKRKLHSYKKNRSLKNKKEKYDDSIINKEFKETSKNLSSKFLNDFKDPNSELKKFLEIGINQEYKLQAEKINKIILKIIENKCKGESFALDEDKMNINFKKTLVFNDKISRNDKTEFQNQESLNILKIPLIDL